MKEMYYIKKARFMLFLVLFLILIASSFSADNPENKIDNVKHSFIDHDKIPVYDLSIPEISLKEQKKIGIRVREELEDNRKVRAIIKLRDVDKIEEWEPEIQDLSKKNKRKLSMQVRDYITQDIAKVKHKYDSFNGFSAKISQEEFDALASSGIIESIEYDQPVSISLQDSTGIIKAQDVWSLQINGTNLTGEGQAICIIDTGVDYTHSSLGGCTLENVSYSGNIVNQVTESEHNYKDNVTVTYKINHTGFDSIAVHFSEFSTEGGWDYVFILDGSNNTIKNYTGYYDEIWSPHVSGDTIYVKLVADDYTNDSGFIIDKIINGTTSTTYDWSGCTKVVDGYDFVSLDENPMDDHDHGTHCAGISAGDGDITGVAPSAKIIAIKAMDQYGSGYESDIVKGIEYCTNHSDLYNISVISMSLGGNSHTNYCDSSYSTYASAINSAVNKNISVVIASGNDYSSSYINAPACIQNAMPIGATEKNDAISSYGNRNWMVQLLAPGSNINSTVPGDSYGLNSGTSMATPHVAGAFAIMNQYLSLTGTSKTPQEIESIFNSTGKRIYDSGSDLNYSRIDILSAIQSLDQDEPEITILTPDSDAILTEDFTFINISADEEIYNTTLNITNLNATYSMNGSGTSWYYNLSGSGWHNFSITAEDNLGNPGYSAVRHMFLNNSAPNITNMSPSNSIVNISEPANQTFSINYSDDGPNTTIIWYTNSSLSANGTANWTFTGGYETSGAYNITVIINDSVLYDTHTWILNINDYIIPLYWTETPGSLVLEEDTSISYDINATSETNLTITYSINQTENISIDNSTGIINYTPPSDWFGDFPINISATDGSETISEVVVVNVTSVNDAPVVNFTGFSINITEDMSEIINLSDYVTDIDNITTTWTCTSNKTDAHTSVTGNNLNLSAHNDFNGYANITCNASDQESNDTCSFISAVIPVNDTPEIDFSSIELMELQEDGNDTIDLSAHITDADNIFTELNISCSSNNSNILLSGLLDINATDNYYGLVNISCNASDPGNLSASGSFTINVTNVDDQPIINNIEFDSTVDETDNIAITVNATDIDSNNLTYDINSTKFNKTGSTFTWQTTTQDSGLYFFIISVSDNTTSVNSTINITITDIEDIDNDGINDTSDYLIGDNVESDIDLNISINSTSELNNTFNGTLEINITHDNSGLVEFNWTFNESNILNLTDVTINKQESGDSFGSLIIKGINLSGQGKTKTIFIDKKNASISSICIKDSEVESIDNISSKCNQDDETPISCPNASGDYNCTITGNRFRITGLSHSAVKQQSYCGDGVKDEGEECDGDDINETCQTLEYDKGTINCNSDCIISTKYCSNSYSSSGGGGGGGTPTTTTESIGPKYSRYFSNIDTGVNVINIINENISLKKLTIETAIQNKNVNFIIQKLDDISMLNNPPKNAYQFFSITAEGINNNSIISVIYDFIIKKSWFEKYQKDNVYFYRYHNGKWDKYFTIFKGENESDYMYNVNTDGFSYYAITSDLKPPQREVKIDETKNNILTQTDSNNLKDKVNETNHQMSGEIKLEDEIKGPGWISRTWKSSISYFAKNYIIFFLVLIIILVLGGTGFNMFYYYMNFIRTGNESQAKKETETEDKPKEKTNAKKKTLEKKDDEKELPPETKKQKNLEKTIKEDDKVNSKLENQANNDKWDKVKEWGEKSRKSGYSKKELKSALKETGYDSRQIRKIIRHINKK